MLTTKLMKLLKEKSLQWGNNNPAQALLELSSSPENKSIHLLLSGNLKELSEDDKKTDKYGFTILDYASVMEDVQFVEKYSDLQYIPVLGEFNVDLEKPLIKNLSFDKKPILKGQNFLMNSVYNFLDQKNFNEAIKLIYPNGGKKTFKLITPFMEMGKGLDFTVFHFAHYCSIYFEDANHFNEILEGVNRVDFFMSLIPLHFIMERMSEKRLKHFIVEASKEDSLRLNILVNDTVNMYKAILRACHDEYEIDFKAINTINELHNSIMNDHNLITRHGENMMLFLERKFPYLTNMQQEGFKDFVFVIPKDRATLVEWGQKMNNCIGGYADNAREGSTIVVALYKNNEVEYNIEINPSSGEVRQFVSHANRTVRDALYNEFQAFVNKHFQQVIAEDGDTVIRFPVDPRFLVRVIKTDSPVNEEEVMMNNLFQLNLSPKKQYDSVLETTKIGFEQNIPKGVVSLILEDVNSKGALCNKLASLEKSAYTGLLKQFKDSQHLNMRSKDYREVVLEIKEKKKEGYTTFFIGIDKLVKMNNKIPSALQPKDYTELSNSLSEVIDGINVFFVVSDVKKSKVLTYKDSNYIETIVGQIFFTHKEKIIDNYFKVDVIKNLYGNSNCVLNLK